MPEAGLGRQSSLKWPLEEQKTPSNKSHFVIEPETQAKPQRATAVFAFEMETEATPVSRDQMQGPGSSASEISMQLMNVDVLLKHEERELAKALLVKILAANSFRAEALKKLLILENAHDDTSKLLMIHEALVKIDDGFESRAQLAHIYYRRGEDQRALEQYFEALGLLLNETQELFEVYKNIGNILMKDGDFDGAEEYYNKAFTLQPESDVLLVNLGTLQIQRNDFDSALQRFRAALEANAKNDKAWVGLALVHNHMGDAVLARANLENALDANPLNRTAVHLLANWGVRDLQYTTPIEYLEEYLSRVDFDEEMSLVLIHLFCLINRKDLAQLEMERVLLWDPMNSNILQIGPEVAA